MVKLSDPITIREMEVKNRLGFPPMLTYSSDKNGVPTTGTFNSYELKARGGVGMITYENSLMNPAHINNTYTNIGRDSNIPTIKKLTDSIHKYNTKIGMQIGEGDLIGFAFGKYFYNFVAQNPRGPSKVDLADATSAYKLYTPNWAERIKKDGDEIRELGIEEIKKIEIQYGVGAQNVIKAGFDYVEIHSGHGMLHASFLSPWLNKRKDEYGGSIENRCRFLVETIETIRKSIGEKPPIFVRFSADELLEDGNKIEEGKKIAQVLEKGGADCLDITQGIIYRNPTGIEVPSYYDQGCFIHLAEAIKKVVDVPVMGVGRIVDPRMAEKFIQQGKADIINMGRQLICDPETPNKYFNGQVEDIRYCIGCLQNCVGFCIQEPFGGLNYKELTMSNEKKKIIILGSGIAGMEVARISKLRGHEVEIFEKSDKIGGLLPLVAAEYKKGEFMNLMNYVAAQIKKLEIPIHLNKDLTKDDLIALKPDILVLATGTEAVLPVKLKGLPDVLTQDEAIMKSKPIGKNVVLWGLETYWKGGAETAITLDNQGYNIKALIGPEKRVAGLISGKQGRHFVILTYLKKKEIPIFRRAKLIEWTNNGIKFLDENKIEQFIEADTLIHCSSRVTKGKDLKSKFEGVAPEIVLVGDCREPRDIQIAIKDAQTFARSLK